MIMAILIMFVGMKIFVFTETEIIFKLFTILIIIVFKHHLELLQYIRHDLFFGITHFITIFKGVCSNPSIKTCSSEEHC